MTTLPKVVSVGSAKGPVTVKPYWIIYPSTNSAAVAEAVKSPVLLMSTLLLTTVA